MGVLYQKGVHWDMFKHSKKGHVETKLCKKQDGVMGPEIYNDKRVFQGIAISDTLFNILRPIDTKYNDDLPRKIKDGGPEVEIRNQQSEFARASRRGIYRF